MANMISDNVSTGLHVLNGLADPTIISKKGGSPDYKIRIGQFLEEIGYRYEAPPLEGKEFVEIFHEWMITAVKPVLGWNDAQISAVEDRSAQCVIRGFPYARTELKLVMSKITALVIIMDDSLDNDAMYQKMGAFSRKLYTREPQPTDTILPLHEECIHEECIHEMSEKIQF